MLGQFYYLNSTLPALTPDGEPPFSSGEFLSLCRGHMSDAEFEALRGSVLWNREPREPAPRVWRRWRSFESGLRGNLASRRAQRLGWATESFDPGDSIVMRDAAEEAMEKEDPLAAELSLLRARWNFLCELDTETFMTLENLIVYFLKLQLLEWRHGMSAEGGRQALADLRRIVETELPAGEWLEAAGTPAPMT